MRAIDGDAYARASLAMQNGFHRVRGHSAASNEPIRSLSRWTESEPGREKRKLSSENSNSSRKFRQNRRSALRNPSIRSFFFCFAPKTFQVNRHVFACALQNSALETSFANTFELLSLLKSVPILWMNSSARHYRLLLLFCRGRCDKEIPHSGGWSTFSAVDWGLVFVDHQPNFNAFVCTRALCIFRRRGVV